MVAYISVSNFFPVILILYPIKESLAVKYIKAFGNMPHPNTWASYLPNINGKYWLERAAFQRSAFRRSTAGNDVVATILISLLPSSVPVGQFSANQIEN